MCLKSKNMSRCVQTLLPDRQGSLGRVPRRRCDYDYAPGQKRSFQKIFFHELFVFLFRDVESAFAFRAFNFSRCVGIALAFVVDAAQLGSSWGRCPNKNIREVAARAKPSSHDSFDPSLLGYPCCLSPCASLRIDNQRQIQTVATGSCITATTTTANQAHTLPTAAHSIPSMHLVQWLISTPRTLHIGGKGVCGRGGRIRSGSG